MKRIVTLLFLVVLTSTLHAQTSQEMQNGAPAHRPGETEEQKGKRLLDEMLAALGGDIWLNKRTLYQEGRYAQFFRNQPNGNLVSYVEYKRFADYQDLKNKPEETRDEYLTGRGVITPGIKRDVIHLWTADQGYEQTYKGVTTLPEKQVKEYMQRRHYSLEDIMHVWIHQPGVIILAAGSGMRDRRPVDKVSILATNNESVTIEIDQESHLPLQRSFETRNQQFKDIDVDEEVYGDWKEFQGIMTPMNLTEYHNGDMASQSYFKKVHFNDSYADSMFDPEKLKQKK